MLGKDHIVKLSFKLPYSPDDRLYVGTERKAWKAPTHCKPGSQLLQFRNWIMPFEG